jgi:hypothetical protein
MHCVNAALADAVRGFAARPAGWRASRALLTRFRSFDRRREAVRQGRRAKVDFNRAVSRFARDRLADFAFLDDLGGTELRYQKTLAPRRALRLGFQKINHYRLGKTFTLTLGLEAFADRLPEPIVIHGNLFQRLGSFQERCWTYVTEDDLEDCLANAGDLIRAVLPHLEGACRKLTALPARLPPDIPVRGRLDAASALKIARAHIRGRAPGARLMLAGSTVSLALRDLHGYGPGLAPDGRVEIHGGWGFWFVSRSPRASLRVGVPAVGALATSDDEADGTFPRQPLRDEWVDSVRALAVAEANGGRERRAQAAQVIDLRYTIEKDAFYPRLSERGVLGKVHYQMLGPGRGRRRMDLFVWVDPATGEFLQAARS